MAVEVIKAKMYQRRDTTTNWLKYNPILASGEFGYDTNEKKYKIGDGTKTWSELEYVGISSDEIVEIINNNKETVYTYTRTDSAQSDNDAITAALGDATAKQGDMCIIKTEITESAAGVKSYEYMAYVYTGTIWAAMDGNVSAENVIMTDDILMAGNYTQVGNITKTSTGTTTVSVKGKTVEDVFTALFTKEEQPTITAQPAVTLTANNNKAYEVGTAVPTSYSATLSTGSYKFGPETGVVAESWSVTNGTDTLTTASGSFDQITVGDDTNYKITATATHNAGAVAKTNLGNNSDPEVKIASGTKSKTSSAITGYRQWFTYVGTDLSEIDSAFVRSSTAKGAAGTSFNVNLTIPDGTKRVYVAIPSSKSKTLASVIDVDGMGLDVKGNFTTKTVDVEGANGYTAVSYDIFVVENMAGLAATTYNISFS